MQVFYSSPWIPPEWIKAHGLEPRGLWSATELEAEPRPLAAGRCAFAEAVLRLAGRRTDAAMIFTTTCDQLRRGFDAHRLVDGARAFLFNVPATWQTPTAYRLYQTELERLGRFLETLGGHPPAPQTVRHELTAHTAARRRLREAAPGCPAREFAAAVARFHWDGTVELPSCAAAPDAAAVPLALVGGPVPASHGSLFDTIASVGGRVVLDATETGERGLEPTVTTATGQPLADLATSYWDNIVDVFQRPNTRLYAWLQRGLEVRQPRGIVLWHFTGCDLWRAEGHTLRERFGLPVLLLEATAAPGSAARETGRLQAFVETLQ